MTQTEYVGLIVALAAVLAHSRYTARWQYSKWLRLMNRERRNRAKQRANEDAMRGWAALMAGRCPLCCGSGIALVTDASPWLDLEVVGEPDWDVTDCDHCKGSGAIDARDRARLLELARKMRGKKLRSPLDAVLSEACREERPPKAPG
jgi:hypothetical protein